MDRRHLSLVIPAAWLLGAGAGCGSIDDDVPEVRDRGGADLRVHIDALPEARVVHSDDDGTPRFVAGELGLLSAGEAPEGAEVAAALEAIAPVFRASPEALRLRRAYTDTIGDRHLRFAQVKNGRRVIGAELVLHVRDGVIYAVNGGARDDWPAPDEPAIGVADAIQAARDGTQARDVTVGDEAPLAYYPASDRMALVYEVDVTGALADGTPVHDTVLVDALDGSITSRIPHVHGALNRQLRDGYNKLALVQSKVVRVEGQAPVADAIVNSNYDRIADVYDCYASLFGRDSYDGAGATIRSVVHYGVDHASASWTKTYGVGMMVFGDGDGVRFSNLAVAVDAVAHEFTHGVTMSESALVYKKESGGLNEAMSDIFAAVCEWYDDGQVLSADTWTVAEDIYTPGIPGDAHRYMYDPALDGRSIDHYSDYSDGIDVHHSSGIANLAFYLLSQGGAHPRGKSSILVTGIGIAEAAEIFYRANTALLTSSATFADARAATEQAAQQLGYGPAEIAAVGDAWEAVGVVVPPPP